MAAPFSLRDRMSPPNLMYEMNEFLKACRVPEYQALQVKVAEMMRAALRAPRALRSVPVRGCPLCRSGLVV